MAFDDGITFHPDEANAVLSILDKRLDGSAILESDWQDLFRSEGYTRLKEREVSIHRPFEDQDFMTFIQTDDLLARRNALKETLHTSQRVDLKNLLSRTLAYLPAGTAIRGRIYPVIKPKTNSFVFDLDRNPAVFLYLDPVITLNQLENTLAHEFHHLGLGAVQGALFESEGWKALPDPIREMLQWVGAFGEGIAMLAAAGGPEIHPHTCSSSEDRARWDESMQNFAADFEQVEAFLLEVVDGNLTGQQLMDAGFRFFGIQGPWYTIGWQMAVTIEQKMGRDAVIEAFFDPRKLLRFYNLAAGRNQPQWNDRLCQFDNDR